MHIKYKKDSPDQIEKRKLLNSLYFPSLLVVMLWTIFLMEVLNDINFTDFGIYPLKISGLKGILFAPLIHGSIKHLFNNSVPLLVLGTTIFYFYRIVAFRLIILSWIITGIWVWFMARPAYHIGASGLIYSWASFIFFSGIIRKNTNLMAISLLITFLYGSMVWGIFPYKEAVSWESHLMGGLSGLILAVFYRKYGPEKQLPEWMYEDEDEENDDDEKETNNSHLTIEYDSEKE